ncbi:C2 calcium-dependent domain-containing protein 4C-like [Acipenser ruthenus]|uniref:C2 calcium-dependent domain-containing protein 4C-like n=1 Tax=Acipenser ruthenus TaxID=7906 RepID=UPI0027427ABF|nr:C2 calcium-dependent domain-containing protein 4C-like [Acipenser ruthenus]
MWVVDTIRVSVERTSLTLPISEYSFKIRDIMFSIDRPLSEKNKKMSLCPNIITPDRIPEFCIPPKLPSHLEPKTPEKNKHPTSIQISTSENTANKKESPFHEMVNTHVIQVENVDELPYDCGYSDEESTNADPQSQAALSLPHLPKAQTSYGFCTLLESPHTRRKESLFHNDPNSCGIPIMIPRSRSNTYSRVSSSSFSLNSLTSRLSPKNFSLHRQGTLDSDTASSTESSPFSSPLLTRSPPKSSLFKAISQEKLFSRTVKRTMVARNNSLSTDEGSSTDNSPNIMRRSSECLLEPMPSAYGLMPPTVFPLDLVHYRDRVIKENVISVGREGTLRLSAEYCQDNQRLRVRLVSAEGLYDSSVDPKSINCCVSMSLVPGKIQKQRSTVIRKSRNPIFNEDFFFDGISEHELCFRSLRMKVVNKGSSMKRDYALGECELPLTSILPK